MDMETISKTELAWLAGIIDGEGCIVAYWKNQSKNGTYRLEVGVSIINTDVLMIKEISRICAKNRIGFAYALNNPKPPRRKAMQIVIHGQGRTKKLLNAVMPYLITKKEQAEILLDLIHYRQSLGYIPTGCKRGRNDEEGNYTIVRDEKWIPLYENEKINSFIQQIKDLKKQQILPSETKRVANKELEILVKKI